MVLALYLGLVETLLIGGGLYLCAMAVILVNPMVKAPVRFTQPVSAEVSA